MLSSFSSWSQEHIRSVFEAKSEEDCLRAIENTFSQKIDLTFNGSPLPRAHLQRFCLAMVVNSGFRLSVEWQNAVEVAQDASTNRDGVLGGYYIIRNIRKQKPGMPEYWERHKSVSVGIASESSDLTFDSRRIVKLTIVATDVPVSQPPPSRQSTTRESHLPHPILA